MLMKAASMLYFPGRVYDTGVTSSSQTTGCFPFKYPLMRRSFVTLIKTEHTGNEPFGSLSSGSLKRFGKAETTRIGNPVTLSGGNRHRLLSMTYLTLIEECLNGYCEVRLLYAKKRSFYQKGPSAHNASSSFDGALNQSHDDLTLEENKDDQGRH